MAISTSNRRTLFDADGNGDAFFVSSGADRVLSVLGNDGGGTLKLQTKVQLNELGAGEWQDFPSASWTAEACVVMSIPQGTYRWSLSGATAPALAAAMSE